MAWSLANAPRCRGDFSGSTLHEWAEGAAGAFVVGNNSHSDAATHPHTEFLKALDPNHLVTMDVEGFFGGSSTGARVFPLNHSLRFVTHALPNNQTMCSATLLTCSTKAPTFSATVQATAWTLRRFSASPTTGFR